MTRDLRVGTAELVIDVDVEEVLVVVAVTEVILPPDTVIETATDPYWCVTAGPANVPSFNPGQQSWPLPLWPRASGPPRQRTAQPWKA